MTEVELKDYLREHYGKCSNKKCTCLKYGTVGTQCESWVPTTATNYTELAEWQKGLK